MLGNAARVYLVGPADGTDDERRQRFLPAIDALSTLGFDVIAPGTDHPARADLATQYAAVAEDLASLKLADYVVLLPGGERLMECAHAALLNIPVMTFADLLTEIETT